MDELYQLERQEARRRAEYEARHAEALRRAESEVRFDPEQASWARLSKSATTSPVITPAVINGIRYPGVSTDRSGRDHDADELLQRTDRTRRRLSGPAWGMSPAVPTAQPLPGPVAHDAPLSHSHSSGHLPIHSHSLGHVVDPSARGPLSVHHGPPWVHPYHNATHHRHRSTGGSLLSAGLHEDSPSPISSDSESVPIYMPKKKVSYPHLGTQHRHEHELPVSHYVHPTPSTSPFLAPFRTLNIHSTNTSRAPSPFLLPPPHSADGPGSGSTTAMASPITGEESSPSTVSSFTRSGSSSALSAIPHHGADRSFPPVPSSRDGSPVSSHHPHRAITGAAGTPSTPSSRAPSPTPWVPNTTLKSLTAALPPANNHHSHDIAGPHHLTHSLRVAFGMTPIHGRSSSRNTSSTFPHLPHSQHTHSGTSTPIHFHPAPYPVSMSMPVSRSGSPPITLPPLKGIGDTSPDGGGQSEGMAEERGGKIELPGFSQFEAATRVRGVRF